MQMSNQTATVHATPEAVQHAFQLMTGHIVASAVNISARLGLSDRLANGPRTADDLARETGANPDALYRVMRALAGVGVFEESSAADVRASRRSAPRSVTARCAGWRCGSPASSIFTSTPTRCTR